MSATVVTKFGNRPVVQVPAFSLAHGYSNIASFPEGVASWDDRKRQDRKSKRQQEHFNEFQNNYANETNESFLFYSNCPAAHDSPHTFALRQQYNMEEKDIEATNSVNKNHRAHRYDLYGQYDPDSNNANHNVPGDVYPNSYSNVVGNVYPQNQNLVQSQIHPQNTDYVNCYDGRFNYYPNQLSNNVSNQPQPFNVQGNDPGEQHFYYGLNGQLLPGPPRYATHGNVLKTARHMHHMRTQHFIVEGVLEYGQLASITLNSTLSFNELPDFLIREMEKGYRRYKRTDVRITCKGGEYSVYATPHILQKSPTRERLYEPKKALYDTVPVRMVDNSDRIVGNTNRAAELRIRREWDAKIDPVDEYRSTDYFRDNVLNDSYGGRQHRRYADRHQVEAYEHGW